MFSKKKDRMPRLRLSLHTGAGKHLHGGRTTFGAFEMITAAPTRFSAVDCPICGCQIRLADRAPRIDLPAITEQHDADAEETEGGEDED